MPGKVRFGSTNESGIERKSETYCTQLITTALLISAWERCKTRHPLAHFTCFCCTKCDFSTTTNERSDHDTRAQNNEFSRTIPNSWERKFLRTLPLKWYSQQKPEVNTLHLMDWWFRYQTMNSLGGHRLRASGWNHAERKYKQKKWSKGSKSERKFAMLKQQSISMGEMYINLYNFYIFIIYFYTANNEAAMKTARQSHQTWNNSKAIFFSWHFTWDISDGEILLTYSQVVRACEENPCPPKDWTLT